jgi:hypothetical protein
VNMPLDRGWQEDNPEEQNQDPTPDLLGWGPGKPVHVKVTNEQTQNVASEFSAWANIYPILAGSGVATQVAPHRYHRNELHWLITVPAGTTLWLANKPDPISTPTPAVTNFNITGPVTNMALPTYKGQQPVYATYTGTGPVTIMVSDETYGVVL